jgi:hypothetical protein
MLCQGIVCCTNQLVKPRERECLLLHATPTSSSTATTATGSVAVMSLMLVEATHYKPSYIVTEPATAPHAAPPPLPQGQLR